MVDKNVYKITYEGYVSFDGEPTTDGLYELIKPLFQVWLTKVGANRVDLHPNLAQEGVSLSLELEADDTDVVPVTEEHDIEKNDLLYLQYSGN